MARTTAAKRPGGREYTPLEAVTFLRKWFDEERAIRIVAICQAFGTKAEALPKGMVTLRVTNSSRQMITIEVQE